MGAVLLTFDIWAGSERASRPRPSAPRILTAVAPGRADERRVAPRVRGCSSGVWRRVGDPRGRDDGVVAAPGGARSPEALGTTATTKGGLTRAGTGANPVFTEGRVWSQNPQARPYLFPPDHSSVSGHETAPRRPGTAALPLPHTEPGAVRVRRHPDAVVAHDERHQVRLHPRLHPHRPRLTPAVSVQNDVRDRL
jgi:hypothetical protein